MKYYVTSGCSYSNETNTWSVHLKKYIVENELGECYNFGSGGGGIDWTRRSIMQGVLDLLGSGVSNDDIKVIVSWPWRNEWEQPVCLSDEEIKSFLKNKEYQKKTGMQSRVYGFDFDKVGFKKHSMFESEYLFKYLVSYDDETWWTRCGEYRYDSLIKGLCKSREDKYYLGLQYMEYFESILSLQMFLETNSIDYTFFAVKNIQRVTTYKTWEECFRWDKSSEFVTSLDCSCKDCHSALNGGWEGQYKRLISPNLLNQKMVYEEYPFIKLIYDQINWNKWWSYKSDVNDFGGTTECVSEQCDIFAYHHDMDGVLISHPNHHAWKDWFDNYLHLHLKNKGMIV